MDLSFIRVLTASVRLSLSTFKKDAKRLHQVSQEVFGQSYPLSVCQEAYARARGFQHWHELHQVMQKVVKNRDDPFWRITNRNQLHEALITSIITSELECNANGPTLFLGDRKHAILPALCLWLEQISAVQLPGLVLVNSKAQSLQETDVWNAVKLLEIERVFDGFKVIDTRESNIPFAIGTSAFCWARALIYSLPAESSELLVKSGMLNTLESLLKSGARSDDETYSLDISAVDYVIGLMTSGRPTLSIPSVNLSREDQNNLQLCVDRQLSNHPKQELLALKSIVANLEKKGLRLGRVVSSESPFRPMVVLFDESRPETVVLASVLHSLYYWRYAGPENRNRGLQTRPVLYFSDQASRDMPLFLKEVGCSYTCTAAGLSVDDTREWKDWFKRNSSVVHVDEDSFVYCGRRVPMRV